MGYNTISPLLALSPVRPYISDYVFLGSAKIVSYFFLSAERISCYICNFRVLSTLAYARYMRNNCVYVHFSEVSKRYAICARMSQKCEFPFWSMLKRQKAELDARLKREVALEKKAFDKMMKHRARVERLRRTIELNRLRLFAKTVDELEKQDKEIEERIARRVIVFSSGRRLVAICLDNSVAGYILLLPDPRHLFRCVLFCLDRRVAVLPCLCRLI